jgi:hypothetical protein
MQILDDIHIINQNAERSEVLKRIFKLAVDLFIYRLVNSFFYQEYNRKGSLLVS